MKKQEPGAVAFLTWFGMGAWVKELISFPVDEDSTGWRWARVLKRSDE
jgi:hypothetical protein